MFRKSARINIIVTPRTAGTRTDL